jgi:hypothetical protein
MNSAESSEGLFDDVLKNKEVEENQAETQEVTLPETEENKQNDDTENKASELEILKNRARMMNITFSNNIGVDALRSKIKAKMGEEDEDPTEDEDDESDNDEAATGETAEQSAPEQGAASVTEKNTVTQAPAPVVAEKPMTLRQKMIKEQMRLVRVRITNLNPNKKDLSGEIFTFANEIIGAVKKFVPYGEATENGYHIPYCIYQQLKEREFVNIKTRKTSKGQVVVETGMAREFALEVMPQLTEVELARLAASQSAAEGMD